MITRSKAQNWRTPPLVFAGLHRTRRYTRDCFASIANHLLPDYWTAAHNTLNQKLDAGEAGFNNPPFGLIIEALAWGHAQRKDAYTDFLLPANIETEWFRKLAVLGDKHTFNRRVEYLPPLEHITYDDLMDPPDEPRKRLTVSSPSFASILVMFGPDVRPSGLGFTAMRDGRTGEVLYTDDVRCACGHVRHAVRGGAPFTFETLTMTFPSRCI